MASKNLIVYFVPEKKIVNGGVMSIFSQCKEARRFYNLHESEVVVCTNPGNPTYVKNDLFENDEKVYSFDEIVKNWSGLKKILLHIPEYTVKESAKVIAERYGDYLSKIEDVKINVMTQNIDMIPSMAELSELFRVTFYVTQTTSHGKYATQALSNKYQTPIHHLSTFVDTRQYKKVNFADKKNLIIYSPDYSPGKEKVIKMLSGLKDFEVQEINGLTYDEYKKLTSSAKFCITFGEGFDGYFTESFFSGSIGVATYNERFFPDKDFLKLNTVFDSYETMALKLPEVIKSLNNEKSYDDYVKKVQLKLQETQDYDMYVQKMEKFYEKKYDFLPDLSYSKKMILDVLSEKNDTIKQQIDQQKILEKTISELQKELEKQSKVNQGLHDDIQNLVNSNSWKVTKPLRKISSIIKPEQ